MNVTIDSISVESIWILNQLIEYRFTDEIFPMVMLNSFIHSFLKHSPCLSFLNKWRFLYRIYVFLGLWHLILCWVNVSGICTVLCSCMFFVCKSYWNSMHAFPLFRSFHCAQFAQDQLACPQTRVCKQWNQGSYNTWYLKNWFFENWFHSWTHANIHWHTWKIWKWF